MAYIGCSYWSSTMAITSVGAADQCCPQFAMLRVHSRNVGVFAWTWFMNRCWAIWTRWIKFCWRPMKVWYKRREWSMGCKTIARGGGYLTMLPRAWLWGQEWRMLWRQARRTIWRYWQVCMLMVIIGVEGFTYTKDTTMTCSSQIYKKLLTNNNVALE